MILRGLIQRDEWNELEGLLHESPLSSELLSRDRLGRTLLHYACAKKRASVRAISTMLDQTPVRLHYAVDIGGNSLLHMAAASGNANVVRCLLERLERHELVRYQNDNGLTACMMAWKKYLHPSFAFFDRVNDDRFHLPLTELQKQHVRLLTLPDRSGDLLDLWNKTLVLTYATMHLDMTYPLYQTNAFDPLTAMIQFGGNRTLQCPSMAVWLALHFSLQNQNVMVDSQGNTLLHLAAMHAPCPILQLQLSVRKLLIMLNEDFGSLAGQSVLAQVCHKQPHLACLRNHQGQFPLHLAIVNGKPWSDIHVLLQAHPTAMEECDVHTNPLLLAAMSPKCTLSTLWELLRSRPGLLVSSVKQTKRRRLSSTSLERPTVRCNVTI